MHQSLHPCNEQNHSSWVSILPWSLCCPALEVWCLGQSPQFFCLDRPSLLPPQIQRSYCHYSQTPQPCGRIPQLSCRWSHPDVSCHLLVNPCILSLHPHCLSLHPHCWSLDLPHHLSHHLPGIQYQPHCHFLSQRPGLTPSGSHGSRHWLQNLIGMHFASAAEMDSWTRNGTKMKSALESGALLSRHSGLGRLTCQNCCHLFFTCGQAAQASLSAGGRPGLLCQGKRFLPHPHTRFGRHKTQDHKPASWGLVCRRRGPIGWWEACQESKVQGLERHCVIYLPCLQTCEHAPPPISSHFSWGFLSALVMKTISGPS